jgi:hypothetical protein
MLHIKEIKPLFTSIVTTGEKYSEDMRDNGLIVANKGDLKAYQKVIAVGSSVRDIKVGDTVMIDITHFAVMKYNPNSIKEDMDLNKVVKWNIPWVMIDDENGVPRDCLLISDRDVKFVFVGEEKNESIIMPDKPKIITS